MPTTEERCKRVIAEQCGLDQAEVVGTLEEMGCDSLDCVEIVMGFEEEFGIDISDPEFDKVSDKSVDEIVAFVEARLPHN